MHPKNQTFGKKKAFPLPAGFTRAAKKEKTPADN